MNNNALFISSILINPGLAMSPTDATNWSLLSYGWQGRATTTADIFSSSFDYTSILVDQLVSKVLPIY